MDKASCFLQLSFVSSKGWLLRVPFPTSYGPWLLTEYLECLQVEPGLSIKWEAFGGSIASGSQSWPWPGCLQGAVWASCQHASLGNIEVS